MRRLVFILTVGLVVLALYTFQRSGQPDPNLIGLAVRATVFAMPSPSPQIVEVTRVVEVTRMVEIVRLVEVTPTPTATLTPTQIAAIAPPADVTELAPVAASEALAKVAQTPVEVFNDGGCPAFSNNQYTTIPVTGAPASHPDSQHGDLNLALRGYVPAEAALSLIDISGPSDGDAPQLSGVLARLASFEHVYRARDWNWTCGGLGCRGDELVNVEVSLVALQSNPGEPIYVPTRDAEIYGGGFVALVLYADTSRLTLNYTREDSVANGYTVHLEDFCVDPNLLALYQANNGGGRGNLPAVRNGEVLGTARYNQIVVGVRDRGTFTDPRSRKDWWRGY